MSSRARPKNWCPTSCKPVRCGISFRRKWHPGSESTPKSLPCGWTGTGSGPPADRSRKPEVATTRSAAVMLPPGRMTGPPPWNAGLRTRHVTGRSECRASHNHLPRHISLSRSPPVGSQPRMSPSPMPNP